jgi:hypothetical protein
MKYTGRCESGCNVRAYRRLRDRRRGPLDLRVRHLSEKGVMLTQNMQVGPCIPVGIQL